MSAYRNRFLVLVLFWLLSPLSAQAAVCDVDDDGDGITDTDEMAMGTDFNNPDTDGDGLSDSGELQRGLDPNDWDTDNDMLIDGVEGGGSDSTDGHIEDTDNDGL